MAAVIEKVLPKESFPQALFTEFQQSSMRTTEQCIIAYARLLQGTPYGAVNSVVDQYLATEQEKGDVDKLVQQLLVVREFCYSFEKLDCVTFVETVLALAYVDPNDEKIASLDDFKQHFESNLKTIRYYNYSEGKDTYWIRNHFMSLDWIVNITSIGMMMDCTAGLATAVGSKHEVARARIHRVQFMYYKAKKVIKDLEYTPFYQKLTIEPKYLNDMIAVEAICQLHYLNIKHVLLHYAKYVQEFPAVAVVNIVRPGWKLQNLIGSELNISHVGIVIKKQLQQGQQLLFVHATSNNPKQVVTENLDDYLRKFEDSPTIKGINVLRCPALKMCAIQ